MRCVTCVLVHATVCRVHGSVHTVSYGAEQPHGRVKNIWLLLLLLLLQCLQCCCGCWIGVPPLLCFQTTAVGALPVMASVTARNNITLLNADILMA